MNPLIVVSGHGPAQANFATASRVVWPESAVLRLDAEATMFRPAVDLPVWSQSPLDPRDRTMMRRYLGALMERESLDHIIAVSGSAILRAADFFPGQEMDGVILRGELDFSSRRAGLVNNFQRTAAASTRLWLENHSEMDKAVAHGSDVPHFLLPMFTSPVRTLSPQRVPGRLVIVVPPYQKDESLSGSAEAVVGLCQRHGIEYVVRSAEELYNYRDMGMGRGFPGTVRYRIPDDVTHAVVLGSSAHHSAVLAALNAWGGHRVFVEASIANTAAAGRAGIPHHMVARGSALLERLIDAVLSSDAKGFSEDSIVSESPLWDALETAKVGDYPEWYEQGLADPNKSTFDVFFTTAGIEDRGDGARPQRIRAMSEAFQDGAPCVRLSSNLAVLSRRSRAIRAMIRGGSRPGLGYGENSTAPMDGAALDQLVFLLTELRAHGLRFAWFVRDLHWLSTEADYGGTDPDAMSRTRQNGINEYDALSKMSDIVYAPSEESGVEFSRLLARAGVTTSRSWKALPPAVSSENILASTGEEDDSVHFVYSGGFGGVYDIEIIFDVLRELQIPWTLDLIVRQKDRADVELATSDLPSERVAVTVGEFRDYVPREGRSIGIALLASEYGKASIPFKSVSYLEKRIPVLCFDDSAVARFLGPLDAGIVAPNSVRGVVDAVVDYTGRSSIPRRVWERIEREQSWAARVEQVRTELLAGEDESGGFSPRS